MTKCVYVYILDVLHPRNLSNYMGFEKFNNLKNKILFLFSSLNSSKIKYYVHFVLLKCNFVRRKECIGLVCYLVCYKRGYCLKKSLESSAPNHT